MHGMQPLILSRISARLGCMHIAFALPAPLLWYCGPFDVAAQDCKAESIMPITINSRKQIRLRLACWSAGHHCRGAAAIQPGHAPAAGKVGHSLVLKCTMQCLSGMLLCGLGHYIGTTRHSLHTICPLCTLVHVHPSACAHYTYAH